MENAKNTLVVNLFGGPGAGKTTCAWEIASKLKKLGYVVEYVGEYAKELVWDGNAEMLDGSLNSQTAIYREQKRRVDRLIGKVDFVVTDSPAILGLVYIKEKDEDFEKQVISDYFGYNNFCVFVERGQRFEKEGRIHSEEQSKELDGSIKALLEAYGIYYGTYSHRSIDVSISNMQYTLNRLNHRGGTL